ncbi:MAG: hypothetical protein Q7T58_10405 [Methylotenera sp.]|nr:hypothetical protein [Methylotenera sp.]
MTVAPNQVWADDITYIETDEGWLYLAVVLGLFNSQVVGFSMQKHMCSSLVTDACAWHDLGEKERWLAELRKKSA